MDRLTEVISMDSLAEFHLNNNRTIVPDAVTIGDNFVTNVKDPKAIAKLKTITDAAPKTSGKTKVVVQTTGGKPVHSFKSNVQYLGRRLQLLKHQMSQPKNIRKTVRRALFSAGLGSALVGGVAAVAASTALFSKLNAAQDTENK